MAARRVDGGGIFNHARTINNGPLVVLLPAAFKLRFGGRLYVGHADPASIAELNQLSPLLADSPFTLGTVAATPWKQSSIMPNGRPLRNAIRLFMGSS